MSRRLLVAAYLAVFGFGLVRAFVILDPGMIEWADVMADRVIAEAAVDGSGVGQPLVDLMGRHGLSYYDPGAVAPRPPGAVLAALPTLAVPVSWLLALAAVANVAAMTFIGWASARVGGIRPEWGLAVGVLFLTPFMVEVVRWGNNAAVMAGLVVAAWMTARSRPRLAGVLLGVAVAVKAWPALLVFAVPRRVAAWTLATAGAMTAAGLLLPGVTVGAVFAGLDTSEVWLTSGLNHSLPAVFARRGFPAPVLVGGAIGLAMWALGLRMVRSANARFGVTVIAALLVSPYSWAPYWLAALPVVAIAASSGSIDLEVTERSDRGVTRAPCRPAEADGRRG